MKKFDVEIRINDLIAINVLAESIEEAKEKAIKKARKSRHWDKTGWEYRAGYEIFVGATDLDAMGDVYD